MIEGVKEAMVVNTLISGNLHVDPGRVILALAAGWEADAISFLVRGRT